MRLNGFCQVGMPGSDDCPAAALQETNALTEKEPLVAVLEALRRPKPCRASAALRVQLFLRGWFWFWDPERP
jgi:hypothetical protein